MKKVYIIAGEASGDLHASNLVKQIEKEQVEDICFFGMGGNAMEHAGVHVKERYEQIAIMGFWEVLKKASSLKRIINRIVLDILSEQPSALILVDSSGFNLRVAKQVKRKSNIPIHYYIAPKIWAWGEWRINKIKRNVDFLYCILPFEEAYFKSKGFKNAFYIGNPTYQEIEEYTFKPLDLVIGEEEKVLALLPGSRKQEIERLLPTMLEAAGKGDFDRVIIAAAQGFDKAYYQKYIGETETNLFIVFDATWDLLKRANAAIVASGTATLETALIGCPQVVVYKTSPLSYFLGKRLVKIKYISLVNLVLNRPAVDELIQDAADASGIIKSLNTLSKEVGVEIRVELENVLKTDLDQDLSGACFSNLFKV